MKDPESQDSGYAQKLASKKALEQIQESRCSAELAAKEVQRLRSSHSVRLEPIGAVAGSRSSNRTTEAASNEDGSVGCRSILETGVLKGCSRNDKTRTRRVLFLETPFVISQTRCLPRANMSETSSTGGFQLAAEPFLQPPTDFIVQVLDTWRSSRTFNLYWRN